MSRQNTQRVCPFNVRFAEETAEPGYAARGVGERPRGVDALPGERQVEAGEDVSAETPGVGNPAHPGTSAPSLVELMRMSREDWDAFSRGSAIRRAGHAGFRRNVAVAMGNWLAVVDELPEEAVAVLREALEDEEPLVREHAGWAHEVTGLSQPAANALANAMEEVGVLREMTGKKTYRFFGFATYLQLFQERDVRR